MGVDYEAVAGYGVKLKGNIKDEFLEDFDNLYTGGFIDKYLPDLDYQNTGNHYSGNGEVWLVPEYTDILKYPEEFEKFKVTLNQYSNVLKDVEPEWFCELLIS